MRIRVTTSINVRSNTVPPTPTQSGDASTKSEDTPRPLEKARSKSPIPFLPPRPDMATSRFKATQRPPRGSRLSAWLHGDSALYGDNGRPNGHNRNISRTSTYCYHQTPRRTSRDRTTGLRPAASTRGVIDPVHSPTTGAWSVPLNRGAGSYPHISLSLPTVQQIRKPAEVEDLLSRPKHRKRNTGTTPKSSARFCFPHIIDTKIRQKAIGCLLLGTILAIVLTIYLALAASNSVSGATFHAVFIFFILVLTIIFMHYLIRLCMLALKPRRRYKIRKSRDRTQWPTDEEIALPLAGQPVPISIPPHEQLHGHDEETVEDVLNENADTEKDLPAPPPIYGNWRGSVRADPNMIHWQLHTNQPDVQREARELIFAGSGHRPPSYASDEMSEGAVGSPTIPRPLPLFAERRRAAGIADS